MDPKWTLLLTLIWSLCLARSEADSLLESVARYMSFSGRETTESPVRIKRQAAADEEFESDPKLVTQMKFELKLVKGDVNSLRPGDSAHYQLEITLPKRITTGIRLELFTKDFEAGRPPALGLYDVAFLSVSPGVQILSTNGREPVTMHLSDEVNTLYDRATVNLQEVINPGREGNKIILTFAVIGFRNGPPAAKGDLPFQVTVAVEYNEGANVWVAQSPLTTANLVGDEDYRLALVSVERPGWVAAGSAAVVNVSAAIAFHSDEVTFELAREDHDVAADNILSMGGAAVTALGSHYRASPLDLWHYPNERVASRDGLGLAAVRIRMGLMTNVGSVPRQSPRSALVNKNNNLTFVASIFAHDLEENVGEEGSCTARILVGGVVVWQERLTFKIQRKINTPAAAELVPVESAQRTASPARVSIGAVYPLRFEVIFRPSSGYANLSLWMDIPHRGQTPLFLPCSARFLPDQSGLNLAYTPNVTFASRPGPRMLYYFAFERLHWLKMRNISRPEVESRVVLEVAARISADEANSDGRILAPKMFFSDGHREVSLTTPVIEVIRRRAPSQKPVFSLVRATPWAELYPGSVVSTLIRGRFSPMTSVENLRVQISRERPAESQNVDTALGTLGRRGGGGGSLGPLDQVQVCRLELLEVGGQIPCVQARRQAINLEGVHLMGPNNGTALMELGDLSCYSEDVRPATTTGEVLINVITQFPLNSRTQSLESLGRNGRPMAWKMSILEDDLLSHEQTTLWEQSVKYQLHSVADTATDLFRHSPNASVSSSDPPTLKARSLSPEAFPGLTAEVEIHLDTSPMTLNSYTLTLSTEDDADLSICGLFVDEFGQNFACMDPKRVTSEYEEKVKGQKTKAKIHFPALANVGSHVRLSRFQLGPANRVVFKAQVRLADRAEPASVKRLVLELEYGTKAGPKTVVEVVEIPVARSKPDRSIFRDPRSVNFTAANPDGVASPGSPALFYLDIQLEANSVVPVKFQLMDYRDKYEICSAQIVHVGRNYPCFAPSSAVMDIAMGQFRTGVICNTLLDRKDPFENVIRLGIALKFREDLKPGVTVPVEGLAIVGSGTELVLGTQVRIRRAMKGFGLAAALPNGGEIRPLKGDIAVPVKIREEVWTRYHLRVPPRSLSNVTVIVEGATESGRALITVHDFRLVSLGKNIPCTTALTSSPRVTFRSGVRNSQQDTMEVALGWLGNWAFGHSFGGGREEEDFVTFEIRSLLTDHPDAVPGSEHPLRVVARLDTGQGESGTLQLAAVQRLLVDRSDTEKTELDAQLRIISSSGGQDRARMSYDRSDEFIVMATIRHGDMSRAEPEYARLRLSLPPWVSFGRVIRSNTKFPPTVTIPSSPSHTACELLFPAILFSDTIAVNFTLQVDPRNVRGYGLTDPLPVTTPYRMICEHLHGKSLGSVPCSPTEAVRYQIVSSECAAPLGLGNNQISDCQLSASSAVNPFYAPKYGRAGGSKMWSPALVHWATTKQYLQVDFLRRTRVSRVAFEAVTGAQRVSRFSLLSSQDRVSWVNGNNTLPVVYSHRGVAEVDLNHPVEARWVRVVVEETIRDRDAQEDALIGVRAELFGCYLEDADEESCDADDEEKETTWYSDDEAAPIGRHFAVDPKRNIAYVCVPLEDLT